MEVITCPRLLEELRLDPATASIADLASFPATLCHPLAFLRASPAFTMVAPAAAECLRPGQLEHYGLSISLFKPDALSTPGAVQAILSKAARIGLSLVGLRVAFVPDGQKVAVATVSNYSTYVHIW